MYVASLQVLQHTLLVVFGMEQWNYWESTVMSTKTYEGVFRTCLELIQRPVLASVVPSEANIYTRIVLHREGVNPGKFFIGGTSNIKNLLAC